jgi:hypothetical protein
MELQQAYDLKKSNRSKNVRKKLYVFLFCFIASAFIWLIIKLSDEYSEVQTYPLVFSNVPADKVLINEADSLLTLSMKSKGFKMLSGKMFSEPQSIIIDVASVYHKSKNSESSYYILTREILQTAGKQIHQPNSIISISPDTLFFSMVEKFSKKVPIKTLLDINFAQQYGLSDSIIVFPDSIIISGPKEIIDSMQYINTITKILSNVNAAQALMLGFPDGRKDHVSVKPESVSIYVPVDKYTESKVEIPVKVYDNEKIIQAKTFPENITITYVVPLSKYTKMNAGKFTAAADISKATSVNAKKLKVEITKQPDFVKILKIEPEKIEYILLK